MYPVPIWHIDREIKIRKFVSTRILSGFFKASVDLQIVEVEVICYLALSLPIWHTDPETKMQKYVSTPSYRVFIRQLATWKSLR